MLDPLSMTLVLALLSTATALPTQPNRTITGYGLSGSRVGLVWDPEKAGTCTKPTIDHRVTDALVTSNGWFSMSFAKLDALAKLAQNWDGCGTDSPNEKSVLWARRTVELLNEINLEPTGIVASAEGGIGICFARNNLYSDIECLNTGEILAITKDGSTSRRTVWEMDPDDLKYEIGLVESFIRG